MTNHKNYPCIVPKVRTNQVLHAALWSFFLAAALLCVTPSDAQSWNSSSVTPEIIPGGHRGTVTALLVDGKGRILSAGEDGFLEIWNSRAAEERFQLSPYGIKSMVLNPAKPEITVVESDGLSLYRISAWDYETKKNLFTLRFRDSISYINYSAAGSFLIVVRSGRTGIAFINSETGEVLESPEELPGSIPLAATGRSERNMIFYLPSGILSYWNLETGTETQRFEVPPNISSPILFGNNRFLGGFDSQGLLILDVVTGTTLVRDGSFRQATLFVDSPDAGQTSSGSASQPNSQGSRGSSSSVQFYCLSSNGGTSTVYRMEIDLSGRLTTANRLTVSNQIAGLISSVASLNGGNIVLGTSQGNLWLLNRSGARIMDTGNPERLIDVAVSPSAIAFLTEKGTLGYIPLDYSLLESGVTLKLESSSDPYGLGYYTNIVSEPLASPTSPGYGEFKETNGFKETDGFEGTDVSQFLLWQPGVARSIPMIKTISGPPVEANSSQLFLDKLSLRFPLRSTAIMGKNILFLDTAGTVSILNSETGNTRFTYSAAGSVDAAFMDQNTIIIGRSAITGNTPFMTVNFSTGETVPLAYPALVGIRVYRGLSGAIYGAAVSQSAPNTQTSIIRLDTSNPAQSEKLIEYSGEDSSFTMAESGGNLASTLGGGEATLYLDSRSRTGNQNTVPVMIPLERSMGFPVKIFDGGGHWFIVLDGEGGITWHDIKTGKLLAVFRSYGDSWVLEKMNLSLSGWETIRGRTAGK